MDVHHGHLVHNHHIGFQRVFLILFKPGIPSIPVLFFQHGAVKLQKAVDGPSLITCGLRHTLGRPPRGSRQKNIHPFRLKIMDHGIYRCCLSRARTAGQDKNPIFNAFQHSPLLQLLQLYPLVSCQLLNIRKELGLLRREKLS